jgi:hypothetical protein
VVWGWIFKRGLGPGDGVSGKSLVADLAGLDNFLPQAGKMKNNLLRVILLFLFIDNPSKHFFPAYFPLFSHFRLTLGK